MILLHMKYAVEIAEAKSINRASETLFVGQPTLSRAIKELEQNLGIKIFDRSAKGMFLTPDGEVFIRYAKAILKQVDEVEAAFRRSGTRRQRFSLSCPRASYISDAFTAFSLLFKPSDAIDAFYYETNSANTVKNVLQEDYRLGIVRYAAEYDKYYKDMLEEKNLAYELVAEFRETAALHTPAVLSSICLKTISKLLMPTLMCPQCRLLHQKKMICPTTQIDVFLFTSAAVSSNC